MSTDYNVYLGPFLRARPKLKNRVRDARRCSSGKCKINERQAGSFCPACGAPIETYQHKTQWLVPDLSIDIHEEINDALARAFIRRQDAQWGGDQQWEAWVPNLLKDAPRRFHLEIYEENEFTFEAIEHLRGAEIVWFNTTFPKPLAVFKLHYLEVEITWGLLLWAS